MSDSDQVNGGNKFVRIDQDSDTELQALFDSVLKPNGKKPLSVPYHMRKLPKSFFNPPNTGSKSPSVSSISHSRENSGDSAFGTITTVSTSGLQINHSRAHSSPASLQQTYASSQQQQQQQQQHQHLRQRSYDISTVEELGPLPQGWEQAVTPEGQVYFLNHIEKTTTWEDPRKPSVVSSQQPQRNAITAGLSSSSPVSDLHSLAQQGGGISVGSKLVSSSASSGAGSCTGSSGTLSPVGSDSALGPLPEGWEQAKTPEGEIYFINHVTRSTSWFDPRIPIRLQRAPSSGLAAPANWMQPPVSPSVSQQISSNLIIQTLKVERERLKMRQREIQQVQQDIMSRTRTADPFLSAAGVLVTAPVEHTRQESADSGLGMGNNYSLPHTPEDFLTSIDDDMDGVSEDTTASLSDNIDATDDLVPTLQLGEGYDLLNNVTDNMDNMLTWL